MNLALATGFYTGGAHAEEVTPNQAELSPPEVPNHEPPSAEQPPPTIDPPTAAPASAPGENPPARIGPEPSEQSQTAPAPGGACAPECRPGYVCSGGACISACNPPCAEGYECTPELTCEAFVETDALETIKAEAARSAGERQREEDERARTVHRHDGFYLRLGLSIGSVSTTVEDDNGLDFDLNGGGTFLDLGIGGTIAPGFVLAFGLAGVTARNVDSSNNAIDVDQMAISMGGLLLDWFPWDDGGFHVCGIVGFGSGRVEGLDDDLDAGLGLVGGVGYDMWVSDQWSVGASGKILYVEGAKGSSREYDALAPMVSLTALYH